MTLLQLAHIVNWMYARDAKGRQPKWSQAAGEIAFWLEEDDEEIFSLHDYFTDNPEAAP